MAGGPPSSIDIGEEDISSSTYYEKQFGGGGVEGDTSSSLTYYEKKFGDQGEDIDPSSFIPSYTQTDKGLALFRLILGSILFILGTYALVRFYRSRWVLDIRTRSAYLVTVAGVSVLMTLLVAVNGAVNIVWGTGLSWFWSSLVIFFITPALFGTYICRALRLAVVFHPQAKRALPWLVPERNYMPVLLAGSLAFTSIPVYQKFTLEIWEVIPKQTSILAWVSIAFAVALACLYPFIRRVDDLFNISKELSLVTALVLLAGVGQKVVRDYGGVEMQRWLGDNIFIALSACILGFSIVEPLRRLAFDPLAATKRNYADRVLLPRREPRSTARTASCASSGKEGDSEHEPRLEEGKIVATAAVTEGGIGNGSHCGDRDPAVSRVTATTATLTDVNINNNTTPGAAANGETGRRGVGRGQERGSTRVMEVWDFERIARTPLLAAAFEEFAQKALCAESVIFLGEVGRYQDGDYVNSSTTPPSQFGMFSYITDTFIKAGSIEEVNISDADKKHIVELHRKGRAAFEGIGEQERRMVFNHAYVEVRQMLEANLLRRFLNTEIFKSAQMQREIIQAMMESPLQTVE